MIVFVPKPQRRDPTEVRHAVEWIAAFGSRHEHYTLVSELAALREDVLTQRALADLHKLDASRLRQHQEAVAREAHALLQALDKRRPCGMLADLIVRLRACLEREP